MKLHAATSVPQYANRVGRPARQRVCIARLRCAVIAHGMASKGRRTPGPSPPQTADKVIAPADATQGSPSVIPLTKLTDSNAIRASNRQAAAKKQQDKRNTKHDSRRGALVNIRVAPRRYRLRQSFDQPRNIHVSPSDPTFEGRLTSEINGCYGPRQLTKLVNDFGPNLTAGHCAAAIAVLAGLVTSKQPFPQQIEAIYQPPAAKVADILTAKISQSSMIDCARATYGLARLQLHKPRLLKAVEQHTTGQLSSATQQALAGLALGLSHWDFKPSDSWIQQLMTQSFASMSGFGAQDLANLLFALACWEVSTSQPFLQRCLTAFRGHWGSAGCHAPTLVRFVFAVTQLPACQPLPQGMLETLSPAAPVYLHHSSWRKQKELQEASKVMGINANGSPLAAAIAPGSNTSYNLDAQQQNAEGSENSVRTDAPRNRAVSTYRLPSFNWLVAFLAECMRQIDRMKPAELSTLLWSMACLNHTPDLIFMECWYRACAVHMHAFTAQSLSTALQAIGMLKPGNNVPGGISGRWLQLVLQRSRELMSRCSGSEMVKMLWGLAEIRVWPGQAWIDEWLTATRKQMQGISHQDLSDAIWALARLRYTPPEQWTEALGLAINTKLPEFEAQSLAIVIWGFSSLGQKPNRKWLITFKRLAGAEYDDGSAQQLAKFMAGALAQQNRRQFSSRAAGSVPAVPGTQVGTAIPPQGPL